MPFPWTTSSGYTQNPNPYMGGSGQGWSGPDYEWTEQNQANRASDPYNWITAGFDVNNPFGRTMVDPNTGDTFAITPEMQMRNQWDVSNLNDALLAQHGWASPGSFKGVNIGNESFFSRDSSGNLVFNPNAIGGILGDQQGINANYGGYNFSEFDPSMAAIEYGDVTGPQGHDVESFQQSLVDVTDLINAEAALSDQRREKAWADAAARFGQSGSVASTPYMSKLAQVAADEEAMKDTIFGRYRMETGMDYAQRMQAEDMARRQLEADIWQQQEAMRMQAEMANQQAALQSGIFGQGQEYNAWLAQNQMGMDDYWRQQQMNQQAQMFNQQNQGMQQGDLFAQMMGTMMGYV